MKKFFSLVLALVMALSLTTVAWGATPTVVHDEAELKAALYATPAQDVIFANDITVAASSGGYKLAGIVVSGQTVDGDGHTLTVTCANGTWDCGIYITGGTVKNLSVEGSFRGIFTADASADIFVDNVVLDNVCYTFNSDGGSKNYGVYFSNSTLNGWTSFSDVHKEVVFTNCTFGAGTGSYTYAFCRPYNSTEFVGCDFDAGYEMEPVSDVAFEECTYNDIPVTDSNVARLFNMDADAAANVSSVTTDSTAALYDLYEGDDDLYLDGAFRTKVAAKKLTKTQAGQVAGWDIEGTLYVEITKAEATQADYYLTKHGKDDAIMYLREAENHGVYTLTGKAYDNFNEGDDNCGEWNYDPELVAMYKDDVDGDIYTDQGTTAYMLVGKTVVGVALADEDKMVDHQMEGVYDAKDKLVGVKCAVCGATGKVYESVAKVPFGADYDFFDGLPYVLNKVAVKPADTETKVESAETFDAGIAMYVGMSVMAATGAVVLKKRED